MKLKILKLIYQNEKEQLSQRDFILKFQFSRIFLFQVSMMSALLKPSAQPLECATSTQPSSSADVL